MSQPLLLKSYPVLQMSCASCASSAQNILRRQIGVVQANVNYADGLANIQYDPILTDAKKFKLALQAGGYDLLILDDQKEAQNTIDQIEYTQRRLLRSKVIIAWSLTIPILLLSMVHPFMHWSLSKWAMWILSTIVLAYAGRSFYTNAFKQIRFLQASMDTLVALSTLTAYIASVYYLFSSATTFYFESATMVVAFVLLGKYLENWAKQKTSTALKKLMSLQPNQALVQVSDNKWEERPIDFIQPGDQVLVKPGFIVPCDGLILTGNSFVDESTISGEALPIEKIQGNSVYAGTLNQQGSFVIKVTSLSNSTMLANIIQAVKLAQASKPPIQQLVDKIAQRFVPIVLLLSIFTFMAWCFLPATVDISAAINAMVAVLVVACPCALGLATPTALMVGIGKAASHGILLRDATSIENAVKVNTLVLDKTGTITQGFPTLQSEQWFELQTPDLLGVLVGLEKVSAHPLGIPIVALHQFKATKLFLDQFQVKPGRGATAQFQAKSFFVGNLLLAQEYGCVLNQHQQEWVDQQLNTGATLVFYGTNNFLLAMFSFQDTLKAGSLQAIEQFHSLGLEIHLLTGDNEQAANQVAKFLNIQHVQYNAHPQQKLDYIKALQAKGKVVAMVGDGTNDSAAMAQADWSIAMGKGSDIAKGVAQLTLVSGDLLKITEAIKISKFTLQAIRQNLFWAFIYNLSGIPSAAGILYPHWGFRLSPMAAGAAMSLSSVSVVLNSLRLSIIKVA